MTLAAILWAFASGGFWGEHKGHHEAFPGYPDKAACDRDRPRIEFEMAARGYAGVFTKCVESAEPVT